MTCEREAAVWMMMGVGMMVWACVMIGCQDTTPPQAAVTPPSAMSNLDQQNADSESEASAQAQAEVESTGVADASPVLAAFQWQTPGVMFRGGSVTPAYDADHGAAGARRERAALEVWRAGGSRPAVPPSPAMVLGLSETHRAKFDAAGWIGLVVGGLLVLFGGEAVVLWLRHREEAAMRQADGRAEADDAQPVVPRHFEQVVAQDRPLVFRLPQASADGPRSSDDSTGVRRAA